MAVVLKDQSNKSNPEVFFCYHQQNPENASYGWCHVKAGILLGSPDPDVGLEFCLAEPDLQVLMLTVSQFVQNM